MSMLSTTIHENWSYLSLDSYITGNTEKIKYNRFEFFAKSNDDGIDFDRLSIVSTAEGCIDAKIMGLRIASYNSSLDTNFYPNVLCSNREIEAKADLRYIDKSNNIHIFKDDEKLFSSFFQIKGNIENLKINAGFRNYDSIGFGNSDKEYYMSE